MRTTVNIQNLKCNGCKRSIEVKLSKIKGISNIFIDVPENRVSFNYESQSVIEKLRKTLIDIGYPITGDPNTIVDKAKSYVSCAIGKLTLKKQ